MKNLDGVNTFEGPGRREVRRHLVAAGAALALFVSFVAGPARPAIAQDFVWLTQFGTAGDEGAFSVGVDVTGNSYVAGFTSGTFAGQISVGGGDAFVRKYDPSGNVLWTRQFGTADVDDALGIAVDFDGDVYVAGWTRGTFAGQAALGSEDAFVRKYDPSGNVLWTRQFGTASSDTALGVAVDATGNAYVAGSTFGAFAGQAALGSEDAFVRKYDPSGNVLWTRQFGTASGDRASSVAVDATGNAFVAGLTLGTFAGESSAGGGDAFLRKYDPSGNPVWTRQFGTTDFDVAFSVAVSATGSAFVAGSTTGTFAGETSAGGRDAFLRKYDPSGDPVWTRQFGTTDVDVAFSVAVDAPGNPYVAGVTLGTLARETAAGAQDAFARKYDPSGNVIWTRQFGTTNDDEAIGVAVGATGIAYVAGYTFGVLAGQSSMGGIDAYLVQIAASPGEQIEGLIAAVANAGLSAGNANSLTGKLDAALASLARSDVTAACSQLNAFINEVNADAKTNRVTAAESAALLSLANAARAALACR